MMLLKELLDGIYDGPLNHPANQWAIEAISCDSRKIVHDSLFVALKGTTQNGADFIREAIEKGARVVVTSEEPQQFPTFNQILVLQTPDPNQFLRKVVRRFYGEPSQKVKCIGVTGTNGKTTITYLLESIIHVAGKRCGVVGTINYRIGEKIIPSHNTTPGLLDNQTFLFNLAQEDVDYCIMEVSSHALDQGRVDLIDFQTAIFTNLTSDHLDYHKTQEQYFLAKAILFKKLSAQATAVINEDDKYAARLIAMTQAKVLTYGIDQKCNFEARDIQLKITGTQFRLIFPDGETTIQTPLIGRHNIYNILAAIAASFPYDIPLETIKKGIQNLSLVPGRLERVDCGQKFSIFIDYAHTEDALKNVLSTIRDVSSSKIILVFGCGGDRDRTKRPKMAKIASQLANFSVITSDNPRSEDPQAIIDEIIPGFEGKNYVTIVDRTEAIYQALDLAQEGDIVLIAGKGHETYQIFKNKTIEFDEREIVRRYFEGKKK